MSGVPNISGELGRPGSRYRIDTPALVLDLDALEANIRRMSAIMADFGKRLRPHAKSHKSSRIARLQVQAGAAGVCCATIDEAEVMVAAGLGGILVTSPVTSARKIERFVELSAHAPDTAIVVDNVDNVDSIAAVARSAGLRAKLLVDVELGFDRTGARDAPSAVAIARRIMESEGAVFVGIQAYGGHFQHTADPAMRRDKALRAAAFVAEVKAAIEREGIAVPLVSGGGTGTHAIDGGPGPFTEIQAGSYAFMDADYRTVFHAGNELLPFDAALFVQAAVISTNTPASVTVDAGTKAFALNGPAPQPIGDHAGATYEFAGDEHGRVRPVGGWRPALGDRIEMIVSHCDPTVALYDDYHCVRGDTLIDIWPVDARGRR